jgi:NADH-quinone oxidoreductase subunit N
MSTVVKTAAFAGFFRLIFTTFQYASTVWINTIWVLAALTIIIGNVTAVYQKDFKRMLAYSSIAHAGYMLLALLSLNGFGKSSILYYAIAYSISSITAFGVLLAVSNVTKTDSIDSFNGLARKIRCWHSSPSLRCFHWPAFRRWPDSLPSTTSLRQRCIKATSGWW